MNSEAIRETLAAAVATGTVDCDVSVFGELASTNTWLMAQPPPATGNAHAVLALGVAVARALESLGLGEAMLKWPNDIVWQDRKLGGILVESSQAAGGAFRVVAGIGINIALPAGFSLDDNTSHWARGIVDLKSARVDVSLAELASAVLAAVLACLDNYDAASLKQSIDAFNRRHWLRERAAELDGQMMRCGDVDAHGQLQAIGMSDGKLHAVSSGDLQPLAWSAP